MSDLGRTRAVQNYFRFDGTVVDVEVAAAKASWRPGKAFINILRELTERLEAERNRQREREAALRSEQAHVSKRALREILDQLPTRIFARDESGAAVFVNHAAERTNASTRGEGGRSQAAA